MLRVLKAWLPLALVISLVCGLIYTIEQQNYRQNANDPQIALAEDIASSANQGKNPSVGISPNMIDISQSLAPFIILYSKDGKPSSSSGRLDFKIPTPPQQVFTDIKNSQHDARFTWQPREDTRIAAVIQPYNGGFVLVGRSLREVERREDIMFIQIAVAWGIIMVSSFILCWFLVEQIRKK